MTRPRRMLFVEDSADDAEMTARAIRAGGCELSYERVDTAEGMQEALRAGGWDLVIADYSMPCFHGLTALKMLRESGLDVPFILVSGAVGEDLAVEAMRCGADDYVLKSNMKRLPVAVERELREYEDRGARKRAEGRYSSLVERLPVGLFRSSLAGDILEANPAMVEMLGFSDVETLKVARSRELWARPEDRAKLFETLERDGLAQNFSIEVRRPDGSVIWCEQSVRAVYDDAGNVVQYEGVLVDITTRKRAEEEANRARDRVADLALETARIRSEFLANMSHEIRTPLVGIVGTGELLSRSDLTPAQRRQADIIRSSGDLLLTIVNDILDFSKLAAGRVVLEKLDFDLVALTENLIDSFAVAARAKGIELALFVDPNLPAGLRGDESRLRQVLNNLVSNAIKFTERGEVMVRAIKVADASDDLVRFEVTDTGIGIALEAQGRLFQPFVQAEGSTSRRYGGTGLGLVIAAKLVDQMGGEIGFESEPGRGSNFHFTARFERGAEIIHPWMNERAIACFRGMRAIIVNNSPAARQVIAEYLTSWGVEYVMAGSEADTLDMLKQKPSDAGKQIVALIDEESSEMGAISFARTIKNSCDPKNHKVVVFSVESVVKNAAEVVDAWITKPVRPSHLFSRLLELCGESESVAAARNIAAPDRAGIVEQPSWRRPVRVLLVDDNVVNRTIGAQQLAALGYTAKIADGARRGLEIVFGGGCDIVLMDCEMPEMDGYQAVAEIRRHEGEGRHTVVIALTAHAAEGDRTRCMGAGMDDYLRKPVKLQTLAQMLDSWVRGRPSQAVAMQ
ncbi:MAG: response regulator [Candidatus Binatus sp.]